MSNPTVNSSTNRQTEILAGSTAMMAEPSTASSQQQPATPYMGTPSGDDTTGSSGDQSGGNPTAGYSSQPGAMAGGDTGNPRSDDSGAPGGGDMTATPGGSTGAQGGDTTGSTGGDAGHQAGSDGGNLPGLGDLGNLPGLGDIGIGDIGLGGTGSLLNPVAGASAPLQPVLDAGNTLVDDVNQEVGTLGHELGTPQIVNAATDLLHTLGLGDIGDAPTAGGNSNLVTDVLNAPGSILDGELTDSVSHIGADLSDTINAASSLKDGVIFGSDPSNPVPDVVSGLGHDLQSTPLLTLNGGNNADDGGLFGGAAGSLNGSSTGHLADVDVGPQQNQGLVLDLLNQPDTGPQHTAGVHAVDVGTGGPQLVDLGLLTSGNGLNIPGLNGAGTDGLAGQLLGGVATATSTASAPATSSPDVSAIHDLVSSITDHGVLDLHGTHII